MARKKEDLVRVTYYVEVKNKKRLESLSARTYRSEAIMLRLALAAYLDAEEALLGKKK